MSGRRQGEKRKRIRSPTTTTKSRRSGEPGDQVLHDISTVPSTSSQNQEGFPELIQKPHFHRWIKCIGAMYIARRFCIEPVENAMKEFHSGVTKDLVAGQTLSSDKNNAASKVNKKIRHSITLQHRSNTPNFKKADIAKWQESHWEVAKCFISGTGYHDKASAEETDFRGIISIIISYKGFERYVKTNLDVEDNIFRKLKDKCHFIIHKANYDVSESELKCFFELITSILHAFGEMDTANVLSKIAELQESTLNLSDARCIIREMKALDEEFEPYRNLLRRIGEEEVEKITAATGSALEAINRAVLEYQKLKEVNVKFAKICKQSLTEIVTTHIEKQKPYYVEVSAWNHETFLDSIKSKSMVTILDYHKRLLYPDDGKPIVVQNWDLSLLIFILDIECQNPVEEEVRDFIEELTAMRDVILNEKEISFDRLRNLVKQAPTSLQIQLQAILDSDIKQLPQNESPKKILRNCQMNATKIGFRQQETISGAILESVRRILEILYSEKRSYFNQTNTNTFIGVKPTNLPAERSGECAQVISEEYQSRNEFAGINQHIQPNTVRSMHVGCIILEITCPSVPSLIQFWNDCITGKVLLAFNDIKKTCRDRLKCDSLEFQIILTEAEIQRCYKSIVYRHQIEKDTRNTDRPYGNSGCSHESAQKIQESEKTFEKSDISVVKSVSGEEVGRFEKKYIRREIRVWRRGRPVRKKVRGKCNPEERKKDSTKFLVPTRFRYEGSVTQKKGRRIRLKPSLHPAARQLDVSSE